MDLGRQEIFGTRREYNRWVADDSMEDFALRYTPRRFRKWSEWRVANTALGAASFLALEAIGAAMALKYGFGNAVLAILVVSAITWLTGLPISYYAARYGVDMDLLTRGAGFGYMGATITSLIYAGFTFIFFALEAAILAAALHMIIPLPLWVLYVLCSLIIVPMVARGITMISRLHLWSQPLWLILLVLPFLAILWKSPESYAGFASLKGSLSDSSDFDPLMFAAAAAIGFPLVVQIGEQVDFLRFLPERTARNRWRWWFALVASGPGWIVPGGLKMLGGAFLAWLVLASGKSATEAIEPTEMYRLAFGYVFEDPRWALTGALVFIVVSQIKINLTNAYAGSLAWSNFFARLTHSHPGRVVWLVFNVLIAVLLMGLGVFQAMDTVLGIYGLVAAAWIGALVADLIVAKPLGLSPAGIEFKRANLYDINPVGLGAMLLAATVAMIAHGGAFGPILQAFAPFLALGLGFALAPLFAWLTRGRFYLARKPVAVAPPGELVDCRVCEREFESDDMTWCPAYRSAICSLCCTLESRCHDRCKTHSRAAEQLERLLRLVLPRALTRRLNFHPGHYLLILLSLCAVGAAVLGTVYAQQAAVAGSDAVRSALATGFGKAAALLLLVLAVSSWWVSLGAEARRRAQEDLNRQNERLVEEVAAHERTAEALQRAKDEAESANLAKTRYVAGISHELRTPLNVILGYSRLLLKDDGLSAPTRDALQSVQRGGDHLLGLVDELLDLARIEADRLRLDPSPLALRALLDEINEMFRVEAERKGLRFEKVCEPGLPTWVLGDQTRLRQILINLVGNAIRFTETGWVRLAVRPVRPPACAGCSCPGQAVGIVSNVVVSDAFVAGRTGSSAGCLPRLVFEVSDSGIGIAADEQQRIFEPFERGRLAGPATPSGAGLGLAITDKLVALMGGRITLESQPGIGSSFQIELGLPVVDAVEPAVVTDRDVIGYDGPRRTVLVVDDQAEQRGLVVDLLAPLGFVVIEADGGAAALELAHRHRPDVALLDINMAPMNGWQTAAHLQRDLATPLPWIAVSADVFENKAERLAALGGLAFVTKPVREAALLQALARATGLTWRHASTAPSTAVSPVVSTAASTALTPALVPATAPGPVPATTTARAASALPDLGCLPVALRDEMAVLARLGQASRLKELIEGLEQSDEALPEATAAARHQAATWLGQQLNALALGAVLRALKAARVDGGEIDGPAAASKHTPGSTATRQEA